MRLGWSTYRWWAWWGLSRDGAGKPVLDLGPVSIYFGPAVDDLPL